MPLLKYTGVAINTIIKKEIVEIEDVLSFMATSAMIAIKFLEIIKSQSMIYKLNTT